MFAALPAELQKELKAAYDQRQRQGENTAQQQPATASGKPGKGPETTEDKKRDHRVWLLQQVTAGV